MKLEMNIQREQKMADEKTYSKEEVQQLIDTCFELCLVIKMNDTFTLMDNNQTAAWIAEQLAAIGFTTKPAGSSWGILT